MIRIVLSICSLFLFAAAFSQELIDGPHIQGFGYVYNIEESSIPVDEKSKYQMVFDLYKNSEETSDLNPSLNTVARFINMHGQNGVPIDQMKITVVFHGTAAQNVFDHKYYVQTYGHDNPNVVLINLLQQLGVEFHLCGQSMHARGLPQEHLLDGIGVSLSAMTAINYYVQEGYTLIRF